MAHFDPARFDLSSFDLRAPPLDFYDNPYPYYDKFRDRSPVHRLPDGSLLLSRYEDLVAVYRDAQNFSSDKRFEFTPKFADAPHLLEHHTTSLIFNDPPVHTHVRQVMMGALTRRTIAEMEGSLRALVTALCDKIASQGGGDLISDFAAAIPIEVIGNLLGVPHDERDPLRDWSLAILGALEPKISPEQAARGDAAVVSFLDYLQGLVSDRRAHPLNPQTDVLTRLIQSERKELGDNEANRELLHNCIFILNAGHETTTNLIGNALVALLAWPEEKNRLMQRMAQTHDKAQRDDIMQTAVDEVLRYDSSNQLGNRRATTAFTLGEQHFPINTLITLCIGAANRDPAQFENPNTLNLSRSPNKHLAFGLGIHQCAGLHLARLEGSVALEIFLERFPNYHLTSPPVRGGRARFRGFSSAPFAVK